MPGEAPPHPPEPPFDPDAIKPKELVASLWRILKGTLESCAFIISNWLVTFLVKFTGQEQEWWVPILNNGLTVLAVVTMLVTLGIECLTLIQAKLRQYKQSREVST